MMDAGVPVVPGTKDAVYEAEAGQKIADDMGYPVMIKASAGGGGKGMRSAMTLKTSYILFETAKLEAENAFGDGTMYIEKYIEDPRHIEFQILADKYGNTIHLGERDCSIQRRHQKLIEESPSPRSVTNSERRWVRSQSKQQKQQNTTVQERLNSYATNMEISILLR